MRLKISALFLALASLITGEDSRNLMASVTVSVTNSSYTAIPCPLARANVIQVYIQPSSTAQVFSIRQAGCAAASCTIEVPSGNAFQLRSTSARFATTDTVFTVQTATGAATLQVVAFSDR